MNRPLAIHGNVIHRQIYQNPLTKLYQERKKNDSKWSSRRRPSLCPTGNVAKKYEDLAEIKVHVCQLQLEKRKNLKEKDFVIWNCLKKTIVRIRYKIETGTVKCFEFIINC
jgi:hypothetical protein